MKECLRCGKHNPSIHTCSPTPAYRIAVVEGLKIARDKIEELRLKSESKPTYYEDALMDSWNEIDTLMKKWKKK
jgi:hypothetical protein